MLSCKICEARKGRPPKPGEIIYNKNELNSTAVHELIDMIGFGQLTINRHMRVIGKVSTLGQWFSYKITDYTQ